ncbi:LysE family translocator [Aurantimonas sp. MSK8Z-1]|uniref:LysE family translocator n=1 Tax=Mangrovibrevibacter kandeliae TaxID=2968473 RepID=UPI002119B631|nr:LysE family translocator [Aurantimonas sp. MSK8Z-1]MCW4114037.1 LysE family translocator [Aurantimonas sp. MSK8Z-1]
MTADTSLAALGFALVASLTPGPNNVMLLASGVNFGFRRTIPHMLGIAIGFSVLLVAVGAGLGALLAAFPALHLALKVAGGAYLLYLAWKIGTARTLSTAGPNGERPMTLLQAAAFQWVNPKAWVFAITIVALYADPLQPVASIAVVVAVCLIASATSVSTWAGFGLMLRQFLSDPVRLKWFNIAMGVLLALTLIPLLM